MSDSAPVPTRISGYDAANTDGQRSQLIFPASSRMEYSQFTRRALLAKNRALEANFPFITRIKSKFGRHVAGKGVFPVAATSDTDWNAQADAAFEAWASNPFTYSVDGSRDFWEDQRIVAEELGAGDGETFAVLTRSAGMVAMQHLDPFEVGSLWANSIPDARTGLFYDDGVRYDPLLRPVSYFVGELPASQFYTPTITREISASDVIHVFRRRRAKQFRGIPPLYSGMNDGHDALDLSALAKASAKLHSLLAVSKNRRGDNAGKGLGAQLNKVLNDDNTFNRLDEKFKGGAVTVELNPDEQLTLHASQRPTIAELDGIKFYCQMVALAADLPFSVVFSFLGVGGTATRADLEDAQNTYEQRQDHLVWRHSHRIRTWFLADAIQTGLIPACRDPQFWKADWHGPAKVTVDYGRAASANIDLMKSGMLSIPRYCEERGWTWQTEQDRQIAWLKRAMEQCEAAGVPFERFFEATPGAQATGASPSSSSSSSSEDNADD